MNTGIGAWYMNVAPAPGTKSLAVARSLGTNSAALARSVSEAPVVADDGDDEDDGARLDPCWPGMLTVKRHGATGGASRRLATGVGFERGRGLSR